MRALLVSLAAVLLCAAPAPAQRVADLPGVAARPAAPASASVRPGGPAWGAERRMGRGASAGIGAGVGALAGLVVFVVARGDRCGTPESMCGLGIPVYMAAGALAGGVVGLIVGG